MTLIARRILPALIVLTIGTAIAFAGATQARVFAKANEPLVGGVPRAAEYQIPIYVGTTGSYTGWAKVYQGGPVVCPAIWPTPDYCKGPAAYQWTGNSWRTTYRTNHTWTWVQPFSGDWSWTWTSDRGWLAMRDRTLVIRWEAGNVAT